MGLGDRERQIQNPRIKLKKVQLEMLVQLVGSLTDNDSFNKHIYLMYVGCFNDKRKIFYLAGIAQ